MSSITEAGAFSPPTIDVLETVDARTREILDRRRSMHLPAGRGWLVRRALLVADLVGLTVAFVLSASIFGSTGATGKVDHFSLFGEFVLFFATLPGWVVLAKLHGLYERDEERADHSTVDDIVGVFHLVTVGAWLFFLGSWATGLADPDLGKLATFWGFALVLVTIGRGIARASCRHSIAYLQNTIIVGAGDVGQLVARKLTKHPEYGINLVGFVDMNPRRRRPDLQHLRVLGAPADLPDLIRLLDVERVIVSFSNDREEETLDLIRSLREHDVQVDVVPRLFELVSPRVGIHTVENLPLIGLPPARLSPSSRFLKRAIDIALASVALLLTAPLWILIAWRIRRDSPGPVLFKQTRLGLNMREFTALKFRTMLSDTGDVEHRAYIEQTMKSDATSGTNGIFKLERRKSVTKVGAWLRKTSLDELPQLLNVLRGDMSLVGPRPCIPYETKHFSKHHFERFLVPAGLTGLWQVTARANATFAEALDMDVAYARGWSLGLDLRLLCRTPLQLLRQREATA